MQACRAGLLGYIASIAVLASSRRGQTSTCAAPASDVLNDALGSFAGIVATTSWPLRDLHASQIAGLPGLTAHLVIDDECFHDRHVPVLRAELQACVAERFPVWSRTLHLPAGAGEPRRP